MTRFEVEDAHASRFERRIVGARQHEELWVPAEDLPSFNARLLGPIEAVSAFFGVDFVGDSPERDPRAHLHRIVVAQQDGDDALVRELEVTQLLTFLYFPYWLASDASALRIDPERLAVALASIRRCWPRVAAIPRLIERGENVGGVDRTSG